MIGTGAMTDPYLPLEMEIGNVRKVLELIDQYGFGVAVQTKSNRVLRDIDLLQKINRKTKAVVHMTLTTCDEGLCRKIEPYVSTTSERFAALKELQAAGIPTVVWLSPILPRINDTRENISGILNMCREAGVYGVICFSMGLTLREGNREYFYVQLDRLFPGMKEWYIKTYGDRYMIDSPKNKELMYLFHDLCSQYGIIHNNDQIFGYLHQFEDKMENAQLTLWDL